MQTTTKAAAAVLGAVVVTIAGLRACSSSGVAPEQSPTPVAVSDEIAGPGPTETVDGVPMGWRHDDVGARAAALSAIGLTGSIAKAGFITRDDMIGELATASYGPTLASASARQLDGLLGDLGGAGVTPDQVLWSELVLTARVVDASMDRVRVEAWTLLVVGAPGVGVPRQAWRTVTVDLAWERGDWRVDGWRAVPGPTPVLDELSDTASLEDLQRVTSWPAASSIDGGA